MVNRACAHELAQVYNTAMVYSMPHALYTPAERVTEWTELFLAVMDRPIPEAALAAARAPTT